MSDNIEIERYSSILQLRRSMSFDERWKSASVIAQALRDEIRAKAATEAKRILDEAEEKIAAMDNFALMQAKENQRLIDELIVSEVPQGNREK